MDFENNFLDKEKKNENIENSHYFNNTAELDKIRKEVTGNFKENQNFKNSENSQNSKKNGSIRLTLDEFTIKNIKTIVSITKFLSVIGIFIGILQLFTFLIGIFTIFISLKFLNFSSALDDAIKMEDENKLKISFKELAKGLKFYIISLIVIFIFIFLLVAISASLYHTSGYYYN
ncbi:DUF5362 family protein [Leptotrichia sp. oral taxon 879]|uniref:DUF5362 family protein n=1 Tax=Leptotrichia mesophila TaxID=3239303 RepID=A0AB39V7C2_9FUSO|nr:DUF5362 family protein [Leptotrichia sp. oral taxon 879]